MYGLLNRAIEELVTERAGRPIWEAVKRKAGVTVPCFVSLESYPDALTYDLVAAASEVLGEPTDAILRAFGRHWVLSTARGEFGPLFELAGSSFEAFLGHLDALHSHLVTSMPELVPPSFTLFWEREGVARLRYESSREGLAPMLVGLVEGLAELFEIDVRVEHVVTRGATADGAAADEFLVTLPTGTA